ncbi:hypothetical protein VPH35_087754 [Triticum aestivum]
MPLERADRLNLSELLGANLGIKRQDLQPLVYKVLLKVPLPCIPPLISAGNHARGVVLSARRLGCHAVIVMPVTTPEIKWQSVERLGATVVLRDSYDEAQSYAKLLCEEEGRTFIPPFDHPDIIGGHGTVGMEIVRELQGPLNEIFVPMGGGGLIAAIPASVRLVRPEVKIIGVEPSDENTMALSLYHGHRVKLEHVGGFADGVAVKVVGEEEFRFCQGLVGGTVLFSRDAIRASIKDMFEDRNILEPAGPLALAGVESYCKYYGLKGETVVAISSGANMNCGCKAEPGKAKIVAVAADGKQCEDSCRRCCRDGEKPLAWLNAGLDTATRIIKLVAAGLGLYVTAQHPLLVTRLEAWLLAMVRFILVSGLGATLALGILLMYAGIRMSFKWGSPSGSA